jgi:hypothetical protein
MHHPRLLALVLLLGAFSWVALIGYIVRDSGEQYDELQRSRLLSCQQTYEGVREVFLPFFPPQGRRTPAQQRNLDKLDRTVDRLKARCVSQVYQGGTP